MVAVSIVLSAADLIGTNELLMVLTLITAGTITIGFSTKLLTCLAHTHSLPLIMRSPGIGDTTPH